MPELSVGIVAIGRNEGERLKACLRSVVGSGPVVYVDSGSTDGRQDFARSLAVEVVSLAVPPNFTAARARNAGAATLFAKHPALAYVQFVDGDCEVRPDWIARGATALKADPGLALVFGRRRERYPDRSIYNALCDDEWDVPVGEVGACGGDILIRADAFRAVAGYPETMIAGEEPDMSMRLRAAGWRLARIAGEMTLHDAAITRFGQWWKRTQRAGHAFAELAWRHPASTWPDWGASVRRDVLWGGLLPALAAAGLVAATASGHPALLLIPALYVAGVCLNVARIFVRRRREGVAPRIARASALLLMVGKIPECLGILGFHWNRLSGRNSTLIEYKSAEAA